MRFSHPANMVNESRIVGGRFSADRFDHVKFLRPAEDYFAKRRRHGLRMDSNITLPDIFD